MSISTLEHRIPTHRAVSATAIFVGLFFPWAEAQAQWTINPYLWATDAGVSVALENRVVADETIPFSDLVEDLDMAVQLRLEGQFGQHGVMADFFGVRLSQEGSQFALPDGTSGSLDSRFRMTLVDFGGLYDPSGDHRGITFFYGVRILSQHAEVDAAVTGASPTLPAETEFDDTIVDALVGWRFTRAIGSSWQLEARGDFSAGGSDHTWSAGGDLVRTFGRERRYALAAGYRYLGVTFEQESPLQVDMTMSGVNAGFRYTF